MRVCLIPFFVLFMLADLFGTADRYICWMAILPENTIWLPISVNLWTR